MTFKNYLTEAEMEAKALEPETKIGNDIPVFTDSAIKTKLRNVIQDKIQGFFSDNSWEAVRNVQKALDSVLPNLSVYEAKYDPESPPTYKRWLMVGAFKTPEGKNRAVWVSITASGAGTVEDPMSKYDLSVGIEVLSPKGIDPKAHEVLDVLFGNKE